MYVLFLYTKNINFKKVKQKGLTDSKYYVILKIGDN